MGDSSRTVTQLLAAWGDGEPEALDRLMSRVYHDLRRRASAQMRRERRNHTLETTDLLNEYFLRLFAQEQVRWEDRNHFFRFATRVMRQILVDYARQIGAQKRGGDRERVTLMTAIVAADASYVEMIALDQALGGLTTVAPRAARVAELRIFGGLSNSEIAQVLGISLAAVKRDWTFARSYLRRELT